MQLNLVFVDFSVFVRRVCVCSFFCFCDHNPGSFKLEVLIVFFTGLLLKSGSASQGGIALKESGAMILVELHVPVEHDTRPVLVCWCFGCFWYNAERGPLRLFRY